MENPRSLDLCIGGVDGLQLPQARVVDEELRMRPPVFRDTGFDSAIAGILGDEHFTDGSRVEAVKRLQGSLQKIEATATGDDDRNVASLAEQHLFTPHPWLLSHPALQPQRQA
ncbi:hypothetical protein D3C86_1746550 [compost metagenome]